MASLKVLLIDVVCKKGSTGKIVYDLYTELNNNGHIASICYGRGTKIEEPGIIKISKDLEMYFHAFLTRSIGLTGYFSFFATRRLIKHIKVFKPDLVHIHEATTYYLNISTLVDFLKKNKIKTVWTFHSEFMYTGKCGHAYDCEKWKSECGKCPQTKEFPKSWLLDFTRKMHKDKKKLFQGFDNLIIVTPSKWLAERVKQSFLKGKDIRVIHNGIDVQNIFHPRAYEHLKKKHNITDEKVILAVAPKIMEARKGGRSVLELAKRMKKENIKFIIIGVEDLREKFDDNIIALGRTENQIELAEYYSMADLFLICSKRENFPTTCLESLSCGTPVIGFDAGGTRETAPKGYGHFVSFGDFAHLESTIRATLDGSLLLKTKAECSKFAFENYDKEIMAKKYIDLYLEDKNSKK